MARPVDVSAIQPTDIVRVQQAGRVFHATVRGRGVGAFAIEPHDRTLRTRRAAPGEIIDHWVHASRTQLTAEGQLTIEDLAG